MIIINILSLTMALSILISNESENPGHFYVTLSSIQDSEYISNLVGSADYRPQDAIAVPEGITHDVLNQFHQFIRGHSEFQFEELQQKIQKKIEQEKTELKQLVEVQENVLKEREEVKRREVEEVKRQDDLGIYKETVFYLEYRKLDKKRDELAQQILLLEHDLKRCENDLTTVFKQLTEEQKKSDSSIS